MNLRNINILDDEDEGIGLIKHLQEWGTIPRCLSCPKGHPMILRKDNASFKWRCNTKYKNSSKKTVTCNYGRSIRKGTFFQNSHLSIRQICSFVNLWVDNVPLKVIKKQAEIKQNHTVVDFASFCREVCYDFMVTRQEAIGGVDKIVEIDETLVGKRKYNRGKRVDGQWVFGGIERDSGRAFLVPVDKRDRATLLPIIKNSILPGSTIVSDCWKPYDILGEEGYNHLTVNHSITFKDPVTGACTNKIESTWAALKRTFTGSSRRKNFFLGYLATYLFRKRCRLQKLDVFEEFMKAAGLLYNASLPAEIVTDDEENEEEGEKEEENVEVDEEADFEEELGDIDF